MESNTTSKRKRQRDEFENSTENQRRRRIQSVSDANRNKRDNVVSGQLQRSDTESPNILRNGRQRTVWLMRAQRIPYQLEGKTIHYPSVSPLHILEETASCVHCNARRFQHEPPSFCCQSGQVKLAATEVPPDLVTLFTAQTKEAMEFRKHIRAFNSIFAFTSFGVNLDRDLASAAAGVYTFRAQGQIYHDLPALIPEQNNPRYFQLYFYDTDNEIENRLSKFKDPKISDDLVKKLMSILQVNPYSHFLRKLKDQPSLDNCEIRISPDVKLEQRRYNSPTAEQVAGIWIEGSGGPNTSYERDIVVTAHSGHRHRVKHYFGCYDPLQYPLLFPFGDQGWHQNIKRIPKAQVGRVGHGDSTVEEVISSNIPNLTTVEDIFRGEQRDVVVRGSFKNVSCREYYCFKLQMRDNVLPLLLLGQRLSQQYTVDQYIKVETTRLDFYKNQQLELRAELYQGIVDSVAVGETRGDQIGKRIILPASFVGGPRDMRRRYLDAMALVQRFGKPDLFITMTCNSDWEEIRQGLHEGQKAQDRPDITSRVFRAKLKDLKDQLFTKEIFGKVAAHVHVIEFQKRGLPHAHILVILQHGYKITTPDQFDSFVCVELPDQQRYPQLNEMAVKHMMHGPCGELNKKNSCMVDGECKYHYPRSFCSKTTQGKDSYPIYRRTNDGRQVRVRNKMLDNRWVIPYNPYLLSRYNCHLNVEVCSGFKAVKYLYKYIYKGHDKVAVHVSLNEGDNTIDEIKRFQDDRWVSAQEAMCRIYEFELNEIYPSVVNLHLHLPNKQLVCYWNRQNLTNVLGWDHVTKTMLTEYFYMCLKEPDARKYLYSEFPEHYKWEKEDKCWLKRKTNRKAIGRIKGVSPVEGERYYLRLLLNHVRGPTSFIDLLTFENVRYSSFKKAAQNRGLLESDQSISDCMSEATSYQMPYALRRLFATLLVYCEPADVRDLWNTHFAALSEDVSRLNNSTNDDVMSSTLTSINFFLESMGKCIVDYDLPPIRLNQNDNTTLNPREIRDELDVETPEEDNLASLNLNIEQRLAYDIILDRVVSGKSGAFFIDGPGGTGKTYLYRALLAHIRSRGEIALATATSGVAAAIMPGGRTAHSRFKIPIIATGTSMCNIPKQSGLANLIRRAKLIIWDEAPMAKRVAIETLDRTLKDIMNSTNLFGGKVIVFGGDFRQVLPVVRRGTRSETVEASLVRSYIWNHLEKIQLKKNMRAMSDPTFSEFLLRVGNGDEPTINDEMILLPNEIVIKYENSEVSENELINCIFPSLKENYTSTEYMTNRALLTTTNEGADDLNAKLMSMFPGEVKEYCSFDEAVDDTNHYYQEEFLNTLTPNVLPPHKLMLKPNCPVMLLRNLDPSNGLCNGTRLICKQFDRNIIQAEIAIGQHKGKQVLIPRIPLSPAETEGYPFIFKRKQFLVRPCFAMTINKAQGQTIPNVGIYLPQHVFSHGQLYVALSRGVSMSTTKVLVALKSPKSRNGTYTKNVVYREVLTSNREEVLLEDVE